MCTHPNNISKLNIVKRPNVNPPVAQFSCPRLCVSGIISCDITKSMAPAAKSLNSTNVISGKIKID